MKLTKEDMYELEKIVDIYSGWISDRLNAMCGTAIHCDAMGVKKSRSVVLEQPIKELNRAYLVVRELSSKLENIRKEKVQ